MVLASNGPLEVVFSFDTTGSMYSCLEQVRSHISDMIQRLQADLPGIKTAVIAHGDYCDKNIYVTKWVDFTTDVAELCDFVNKAEKTSGGDVPECYELVLHQTRTQLSWTPTSRRALVLIGDAEPHDTDYPDNKDKIDWKYEIQELAAMGVTIYPVQCCHYDYDHTATAFYKTLATVTGGKHLKLDDFGNVFHVLMAVCYREGNDTAKLASYEQEVRARYGVAPLARDVDAIFRSLRDGDTTAVSSGAAPLDPSSGTSTPIALGIRTRTFIRKPRRRLPLKSPLRTGKREVIDLYRLGHLKREKVPNSKFKLSHLNWSPWKLVLSPEVPEKSAKKWIKRKCSLNGYRLKTLYYPNANRKDLAADIGRSVVLFEVSIKTPRDDNSRRSRHNIVYSSFSKRIFNNTRWELSFSSRVRGQIERLLTDGCSIFMRFYNLSLRDNISSLRSDLRLYDYAWKSIRNERSCPRTLNHGGHCISRSLGLTE